MFPKLTSYMLGSLSQTFRGRWEKKIKENNQHNTGFKVPFLLKGVYHRIFSVSLNDLTQTTKKMLKEEGHTYPLFPYVS